MSAEVVLDPHSENLVEPGLLEVRDEITFLKYVNSPVPLFIHGHVLCDWAADVARARGWQISWRSAPSLELLRICPSLSPEQARAFLTRVGSLHGLKRPLSLLDLGIAKWPEIDPSGKSEAEQAWSWLLWKARADLAPEEQVFAVSLGSAFQIEDTPALRLVFAATDVDQAWRILKEWLCCDRSRLDLPSCPATKLPAWALARLEDEWRIRAVQTRGSFFGELVEAGAPRLVLKTAGSVIFAYYRNNPEYLSQESLGLIKAYLRVQEWQTLQDLLPTSDPGSPPTTVPEVFTWFSKRYLKFRLWKGQTSGHLDRTREIGREFGLWYLKFYSNARAGGAGGELMSWSRTAELAKASGSVNLLIVLDGLGYADAQQITDFISDETARLSLDGIELLFAPLPTITRFAKPSLMAGVTPVQAFEEEEIGSIEKRDPDVVTALNAATPGTLIIWSLLEPDETYHKPHDVQTLRYEVEGRLRSIAQRVTRIVNDVHDGQKLRVFITTDHGRLLSVSRRAHEVPPKMKAHGRAAWGPASVPFDNDGIFVDGALAYVDAERFGLPEPAAIVLADTAFLTSDGRTGTESFPHGGVYPEEVLIPWIEFTRDRGPVSLSVRLTGHGVAGAAGQVRLEVTNASDVRIEIVQLYLYPLNVRIGTSVNVRPFKRAGIEWTLLNWPQRKDLASLEATMTYAMPTGERQSHRVVPEFAVDEMYSRETILDDLL